VANASLCKHFLVEVRPRARLWLRTIVPAVLVFWVWFSGFTEAQLTERTATQRDNPSSIHGRVLNRVTHEPVSRALVFLRTSNTPRLQMIAVVSSLSFHRKFRSQRRNKQARPTPQRSAPVSFA
jgi:hypothetical protein